MSQSIALSHLAIIMDGNGRWAERRGRARTAGHLAGARTTRRIVEAVAGLGIGTLTLYAFSADNWRRPAAEVGALMRLFRRYLHGEAARCVEQGVRLTVIGRRDRLDAAIRCAIEGAERSTAAGKRLHLRIALDYSARDALVAAAASPPLGLADGRADLAARLGRVLHDREPVADVDLLIRTGGDQRLSDFLLWECAYAELWFTSTLWPDFTADELQRAIDDYRGRERRFGALPSLATEVAHAHA